MNRPISRPTNAAILYLAAVAALGAMVALAPVARQDTTPPKRNVDSGPVFPEVIVTLSTGQRLRGLLTERTADRVTVIVAGARLQLAMKNVDSIDPVPDIHQRYRTMLEAASDDPESLIAIAAWLVDNLMLEEAESTLTLALKLAPDNRNAAVQLRAVRAHIEIYRKARERLARGERPAPLPEKPEAPGFPVLAEDEINLLKVFEVDLNNPPRILIDRETIVDFVEAYRGRPGVPVSPEARRAFFRKRPAEIVALMFELRAREFYGRVRIQGPTRAFRLFRENVQRAWLVRGCATSQCHGGPDGGILQLATRRAASDEATFTNFLILDRTRLSDGTPLINYEDPISSPLLEIALPRDRSRYPHPVTPHPVTGQDMWRPLYRTLDDRRAERVVEWIQAMYRPRPDYPIEYVPPGMRPPEKPTETELAPR